MVILKFGSAINFSTHDVKPTDVAINDDYVVARFKKVASQYKRIAPKANEFLYFSAIMMHAAERSLYDDNNLLRKSADGSDVKAEWLIDGNGSWKWKCSDASIKPYKNNNGDIFPESELKKAYKKWVGKPLCKDHQSSSVEGMRGLIIDTFYDEKNKCIIGLCALDKVTYGDLARNVQTGVANSVSMGTAVGRSICTECGNIAKTEGEYCDHVKNRIAYGEINVDLAPIELSLVVNGADPLARVRQIIAATNTIENTLKKSGTSTTLEQLSSIKEEVSDLLMRVASIEHEILAEKDDNNFALRATAAQEAVTETRQGYQNSLNLIKTKMSSIEEMIGKIAKFNTEELMSQKQLDKKGFYQGTEEPTPGQPKYEKDPMAEQVRNNEDRQLKNVPDVGPIDGMYPGDLEKKKMLARAKLDERKALRAEAVAQAKAKLDKSAYMQGTEEPTTYKVDPLADKAQKEDKQMHADSTIKPDGMMGNDAKTKKELNRASLKGYFIKAATPDGNDDTPNHRWDIMSNNKVVFSATLNELTGGKPALYGAVSTKNFGRELLRSVHASGVQKTVQMFKVAQVEGELDGAIPPPTEDPDEMTPPMGDAPPPMDAPPMDESMEGGEEKGPELRVTPSSVADPIEKANLAADAVKENAETVSGVLSQLADEIKDGLAVLEGEGTSAPVEDAPELPGGLMSAEGENPEEVVAAALRVLEKNASEEDAVKALQNMEPVLKAGLMSSFKNIYAEINDTKREVDMVLSTMDIPGIETVNADFVTSLVTAAIDEAKDVIKKAEELQKAFVKYARGTEGLEKKAAALQGGIQKDATKAMPAATKAEKAAVKAKIKAERAAEAAKAAKEEYAAAKAAAKAARDDEKAEAVGKATKVDKENKVDNTKGGKQPKDGKCGPGGVMMGKTKKAESEFDLNTIDGRKGYRRKIAADALKVSEMLGRAHPSGSETLGQLDTKSSEAVVEDLPATHSKMEEVARKDPKVAKVAANAKELDNLIKAGRVKVANLDQLVANGMDAEAVSYWKKYYGQVDGGSEFASGLVGDYENKKSAAVDEEAIKVKIARAFEIAHEMREVGLIPNSREAVKNEVERVVKWNPEAYETMRRVIATHRTKLQKTASDHGVSSIQNGLAMDSNITTGEGDKSLYEQINDVFSNHTFKNNF